MTQKKPTCGRCGVYRHLHPTKAGCTKPRRSFWWDRHSLTRHIAGRAWLALSDRQRFAIVDRMHKRKPHLCWCDFMNSAYLDTMRDDYSGTSGCGCDVPLPTDVSVPRPGWCYCGPAVQLDAHDDLTARHEAHQTHLSADPVPRADS